MKNGKMRKVKNSKVYKETVAHYESELKMVREVTEKMIMERNTVINENVELKRNVKEMTGLISGYENRRAETEKLMQSKDKELIEQVKNAQAWEDVATELMLTNKFLMFKAERGK